MARAIANRWRGVGSAYPRGLFAAAELGCWFDCALADAFTDTACTLPAITPGSAVAGLLGRSGAGLNAAQVSAGQRPLLARRPMGGARNLLTWTTDLTNGDWSKTNCMLVLNGDQSCTLTNTGAVGHHGIYSQQLPTDGGTYVRSIEVKKGNARYVSLSMNLGPSSAANAWIFDLDTGTFSQSGSASLGDSVTALANGWYRISFACASTAASSARLYVGIAPAATGTALQYAGAGETLLLRNAQGEAGLTPSAYQRVTIAQDVTETGKPDCWHLWSDLVDDAIPVVLPNLGANATLFYAVEGSTVILPAQTIGAGSFAVLRGQRTFAVGAINRALTAPETATLTAYLNARRGA